MTIRNKVCPICGHRNVDDARYCSGKCGRPFQYSPQVSAVAVRRSDQHVRQQNYPITTYSNSNPLQSVANDLEFMRFQLFQTKDRLKRGGFLWHIFGQGSYRRQLEKRVEASFTRIEAIWQDAYLRYHEQEAAHRLRRQQQEYEHERRYREFLFDQRLLDETLQRRFQRLALAIDTINQLFVVEGRLNGLKDRAVQQEIALAYIRQAERLALGECENAKENHNDLDYLEKDY